MRLGEEKRCHRMFGLDGQGAGYCIRDRCMIWTPDPRTGEAGCGDLMLATATHALANNLANLLLLTLRTLKMVPMATMPLASGQEPSGSGDPPPSA